VNWQLKSNREWPQQFLAKLLSLVRKTDMLNKRSLLRLLLVGIFFSLLSACSTVGDWFSSDDDDPRQPAELEKIEQSVEIKKLWSTGVGNGQGEGLYKLRPAIRGDVIYAASAEGEIVALNRQNGKKLWDVELETNLSGGLCPECPAGGKQRG
jgi:outer membrane protein assembly factor BamB